jgi:branched-chain amino acid transport system permease protein
MVTFAPGGIAGLVLMHQPLWRSGRIGRLAGPYSRLVLPGLLVVAGFVLLIELCSFVAIGAAQGRSFTLSGMTIDPQRAGPWLAGTLMLAVGAPWLWREARRLRAAWEVLMEDIKGVAAP